MQNVTGNKIRLGIFVSAGFILFIAGIYFIGKRQQMFNSTFKVSGIFKDISGLQVGNNVRFSGINVGIIDNIQQITDSSVQVDMLINQRTRKFIKKSAVATIGSDGLMGNKIVVISAGSGTQQEIANNDIIRTVMPVNMDEILHNVKVASENAAMITEDLASVIGNIRHGKGTIGKLFSDSIFAKNIDQTVVNIKQGTGGFKQNMDAVGHNFLLKGFIKRKQKREARRKEKEEKEN